MDTLLTIGMITRETAIVLENELTFTRRVSRKYDDQFAKTGAKIGNVLNVRLPVRFTNSSGQGLILQDLQETSVPVTLTTQYQRSFTVTSSDLALSIDDFRKRFVDKAVISMANQIDYDGLGLFLTVYNEVGTPGTVPTTADTYLDAGRLLSDNAAPMDDRCLIINPVMNAKIVSGLAGLFNPQRTIGEQYTKGMMSKDTLGFDWYMDQNVRTFAVGPQGGTPLANSATTQTGASIVTDGWTSGNAKRLNQGDIITFGTAGASNAVYAVNPQSFQSTGFLKQFVVTADVSDSSGALTIPLSPAIVTSGPYQNVTQGVVDNAPVSVNGAAGTSSGRGLAFCEEAFTFANADLPLFGGLDMGDRIKNELDLSVRCIRDYDINLDRAPLRLDLLGGWAPIYPQLAVRIAS